MPAPEPSQPIKYLSVAEMRAAIKAGGSVLIQIPGGRSRHATTVEDLPTEAELAGVAGDPATAAAARLELDEKIASLTRQRDSLAPAKPAEPEAEKPKVIAPTVPSEPKPDDAKPKGK